MMGKQGNACVVTVNNPLTGLGVHKWSSHTALCCYLQYFTDSVWRNRYEATSPVCADISKRKTATITTTVSIDIMPVHVSFTHYNVTCASSYIVTLAIYSNAIHIAQHHCIVAI